MLTLNLTAISMVLLELFCNLLCLTKLIGLRDYYSLIKCLSQGKRDEMETLKYALERNFGGLPVENNKVSNY